MHNSWRLEKLTFVPESVSGMAKSLTSIQVEEFSHKGERPPAPRTLLQGNNKNYSLALLGSSPVTTLHAQHVALLKGSPCNVYA